MAPEKIIMALVLLSAIGFSAAPAWIVKGAVLEYSAGTDTVTFTILDRTAENLKIDIKAKSAPSSYTANENASGTSGQFWHDSSLLSGATYGSTFGDFSVTDEGKQTFAGKEYDTITLEGTIDEITTTKVYEKSTGLMLRQTVNAPGAPTVTLIKYSPPAVSAPPPPSQPPPQPPANQTPPQQPSQPPVSPPAANGSQQPPSQPGAPYQPSPQEPPAVTEEPEESGKKPITELCCPSAAVLLMVGFAAARRRDS
jgi:hypothetical protein